MEIKPDGFSSGPGAAGAFAATAAPGQLAHRAALCRRNTGLLLRGASYSLAILAPPFGPQSLMANQVDLDLRQRRARC